MLIRQQASCYILIVGDKTKLLVFSLGVAFSIVSLGSCELSFVPKKEDFRTLKITISGIYPSDICLFHCMVEG